GVGRVGHELLRPAGLAAMDRADRVRTRPDGAPGGGEGPLARGHLLVEPSLEVALEVVEGHGMSDGQRVAVWSSRADRTTTWTSSVSITERPLYAGRVACPRPIATCRSYIP